MSSTVDFYFDPVSPYAYIALVLLQRYKARWNLAITYKPAFLAGIMKGAGNQPPMSIANKGAWMRSDIDLMTKYYSIPLTLSPQFPFNSISSVRFLRCLQDTQPDKLEAAALAFYRATFIESCRVDASKTANFPSILSGIIDADLISQLIEESGSDANKNRVKQEAQQIVDDHKAFGFPWIVVTRPDGKKHTFWGADRFEYMAYFVATVGHVSRCLYYHISPILLQQMDAFEIRLRFVDVIRKLTSSQQSIQKLVAFAIKQAARCGTDLWDCLLEECEKANLNSRINIFYALDSLLESAAQSGHLVYVDLVNRDLQKIVDLVVPSTKEGILNLLSAKQILYSWRVRRVIQPALVDAVIASLSRVENATPQVPNASTTTTTTTATATTTTSFSRADILRRIEDDRERHKRLREKIWVLPQPPSYSQITRPATYSILRTALPFTTSPTTPASPADVSLHASTNSIRDSHFVAANAGVDPIDVEFEQLWETEDVLGPDDFKAMHEENERCFRTS